MLRVRTQIGGPLVVGGGLATHYFDPVGSADAQSAVEKVETFWEDLEDVIQVNVTFLVEPEVVVIDPADGSLQDIIPVSTTPLTGAGTDPSVARATQGLLRLTATGIVNNRRIQGRTFIPGVMQTALQGGGPNASYVSALTAAGSTLRDGDENLVVWSRPAPGRQGVASPVQIAQGSDKFAVLRSRRD